MQLELFAAYHTSGGWTDLAEGRHGALAAFQPEEESDPYFIEWR